MMMAIQLAKAFILMLVVGKVVSAEVISLLLGGGLESEDPVWLTIPAAKFIVIGS